MAEYRARNGPAQAWHPGWRQVWRTMSAAGCCDGIDGAEYHRVTAAWLDAGAPPTMRNFIFDYANRPLDAGGGGG